MFNNVFKQSTCAICYDFGLLIVSFTCDCNVCKGCFLRYFSHTVEQNTIKQLDSICCPGGCDLQYPLEQIIEVASQNCLSVDVDDILLKKYLVSQEDIRGCPSPQCGYYGTIKLQTCREPLKCQLCETEWECQDLQPWSYKLYRQIVSLQGSKEFLTYIYEFLFTNECPKCQIPIFKNGGCPHMTCIKCAYEFCWYCKQSYNVHNPNKCMSHVITYYGILLNFWFNLLCFLHIHHTILEFIFLPINFILRMVLHDIIALILGVILKFIIEIGQKQLTLWRAYPKGNAHLEQQRNLKLTQLGGVLVASASVFYQLYTFTKITVSSWLLYLYYQGIVMACIAWIGFISYQATNFIINNWIRYVL